jgi:hypothetical protein
MRVGNALVRLNLFANRQSAIEYLFRLLKPLAIEITFAHPSKHAGQLPAEAKTLDSREIFLAERHHAGEVRLPATHHEAVNQ